ncbi:MAG: formate dehydrogenase accessory sulfurtransferase FdhD [Actinomycetota bacterium]|nr:formate dehydrogenase accessory sulfurtransferase FdhD [Actinomycetota bacterium]
MLPRSQKLVRVVEDGHATTRPDYVATEEPLEIRLVAGGSRQTLAVTMRTPGSDFELAVGFLFSEGIISSGGDLRRITYCTEGEQRYNVVNVELAAAALPELQPLERHFFTSSACGVCGKASLDQLEHRGYQPLQGGPTLAPDVLYGLPERLREAQGVFRSTGGLHAAGLFASGGELVALREDVGRHNALDKLVGSAVLQGMVPLHDHLIVVSGRTSYEILQKAIAAGVPAVCGISAPSSLAVALAERFGVTLVGFLRDRRFNVYAHAERVALSTPAHGPP